MTTRDSFILWAREQVGSNDRVAYWLAALGYDPGKKKAWCGAFYLAGLHAVGLALDHKWGIDGTGVQALHLPQTKHPEPGDLGYQHAPYQHHFVVETVGEHTYTSIDGNQGTPGVQRHERAFKTPGVVFYSIAKLLGAQHDTDPAPPPARPVLKLGATGPDVRTVQTILNSHGAQLVVDGKMGPLTVLAVQSLQRRAGLDADGVIGPRTWAVLEAV